MIPLVGRDFEVPAYYELNLRFGWHVTRAWEFSVNGNNLLHARHTEYEQSEYVPPSFRIEALWQP